MSEVHIFLLPAQSFRLLSVFRRRSFSSLELNLLYLSFFLSTPLPLGSCSPRKLTVQKSPTSLFVSLFMDQSSRHRTTHEIQTCAHIRNKFTTYSHKSYCINELITRKHQQIRTFYANALDQIALRRARNESILIVRHIIAYTKSHVKFSSNLNVVSNTSHTVCFAVQWCR